MSQIRINLKGISNAGGTISDARNEVVSAKQGIRGTANYIDSRILSRHNIRGRIDNTYNLLNNTANKMQRISSVVSYALNEYQGVEKRAIIKAGQLGNIGSISGKSDSNKWVKFFDTGKVKASIGKDKRIQSIKKSGKKLILSFANIKKDVEKVWGNVTKFYEKHKSVQILGEIAMDVVSIGASIVSFPTNPTAGGMAMTTWDLINGVFTVGCDLGALACVGIRSLMVGAFGVENTEYVDGMIDQLKEADGLAGALEVNGNKKAAQYVKVVDTIHDAGKVYSDGKKIVTGSVDLINAGKKNDTEEVVKQFKKVYFGMDSQQAKGRVKQVNSVLQSRKSNGKIVYELTKTGKGIKTVNTAAKGAKKIAEGDYVNAAFDFVKPYKVGTEIVDVYEDIEEIKPVFVR